MFVSFLLIVVFGLNSDQTLHVSDQADSLRKVGWLEFIGQDLSGFVSRGVNDVWLLVKKMPLQISKAEDLKSLLKDTDESLGKPAESGRLFTRGRELTLGLRLDEAASVYREAIAVLDDSYVMIHNPEHLAQLWLYLGVNRSQAGKKDQAEQAFRRALGLVPELKLSVGYFSPSVRELFTKVRDQEKYRHPSIPNVAVLAKVCRVALLDGIIVVSRDTLADREVLRWAWYDADKGDFTRVETMVVGNGDPAFSADRLAKKLAGAFFKKPVAAPESNRFDVLPTTHVDQALAEPKLEPWYTKHWWIWPVAAAVLTAGVAIPISFLKNDVVRLRVHH